MALLGLALLCAACAMRSVGSPLTAPLTPKRPGNPDLLIRFPLWRQKARAFLQDRSIEQRTPRRLSRAGPVRRASHAARRFSPSGRG